MNAYGGEGPPVVSTLAVLSTAASSTWTTAKFVMLGGQMYITYKGINSFARIGSTVEQGAENLISHGMFAVERLSEEAVASLVQVMTTAVWVFECLATGWVTVTTAQMIVVRLPAPVLYALLPKTFLAM